MEIAADDKLATLLYVEDDTDIREQVISIIQLIFPRITLVMAENGQVGLDLFRTHRPDIVLTDINLPGIKRWLLFRHKRHTALALAAEDGPFRAGLGDVQSERFALAAIRVEDKVSRAIRLLHNTHALARLQLDEALGARGLHPWRWFALLGPQIILKALLALDRWRRNFIAVTCLQVKSGAVRASRFIARNTFAL